MNPDYGSSITVDILCISWHGNVSPKMSIRYSIYLKVRQFPIHPQTAIGTVKHKYINTPALYAKNSSGSEVKLSVVDLMFVTFVELLLFAHNTMFAWFSDPH